MASDVLSSLHVLDILLFLDGYKDEVIAAYRTVASKFKQPHEQRICEKLLKREQVSKKRFHLFLLQLAPLLQLEHEFFSKRSVVYAIIKQQLGKRDQLLLLLHRIPFDSIPMVIQWAKQMKTALINLFKQIEQINSNKEMKPILRSLQTLERKEIERLEKILQLYKTI